MFHILKRNKFQAGLLAPDYHDSRDYLISSIQKEVVSLPVSFDLRDKMTPIEFQNGKGICFPGNTPVLMGDMTYKSIADIREGEEVYTHKRRKRRVVATMKRKWQGRMFKIVPQGINDGIISTPEHPYLVVRRIKKKIRNKLNEIKFEWVEANKIRKGDYLAIPIPQDVKDKTIYWQEKDPDFLWLLGVYLAEGSVENNEITFSISIDEAEFRKEIIQRLKKFKLNPTWRKNWKGKGIQIRFNNRFYSELFVELGGKGALNKRINPRLMFLPPELQLEIYKGWFEGDGHRGEIRDMGATISFQLAYQLRTILIRNKIPNSVLWKPSWIGRDGVQHKEFYSIEVYPHSIYHGIITDNYILTPIRRIEKIPAYHGGNVYNLEVEEDNSYVVKSVAVHNCYSYAISGIKQYEDTKETCFQWKMTKITDVYLLRRDIRYVDLSERFIVHTTKKISNLWNIQGDYFRHSLQAITKYGAPLEEDWKTDLRLDWDTFAKTEPPAEVYQKALKYRGGSYWRVLPRTIENIKQTLYQQKTPLLVGMMWYQSFNKTEPDGHLPLPAGNRLGGHAISIVGWESGKIWFRNSYGKWWGKDGYFYIKENDFYKYPIWDIWVLTDYEPPKPKDEGWVAIKYLRSKEFIKDQEVYPVYNLNFREEPGIKGRKIGTIKKGNTIKILDNKKVFKDNYWWQKIKVVEKGLDK